MSERSKKKILYILVITSVFLNLLLMVNVFALKLVSRRSQPMRSQNKILRYTKVKFTPVSTEEITNGKKNLLQTSYELGLYYEKKADKVIGLQDKADFYSLALLEYAKLPKNKPYYAKLVRQGVERIQPEMLEISTPLISLGDTRRQVEQIYGIPDRQVIDEKYMPSGTITYDHYISQGLIVGMSLDHVFSIKLCSYSPGLWNGVRIGDEFETIRTLYKGEKVALAGKKFGYKVDKLKTTFVFVDKDNKLDGIKISDPQYYGNWEMALN